jgi:hypothetical protein
MAENKRRAGTPNAFRKPEKTLVILVSKPFIIIYSCSLTF